MIETQTGYIVQLQYAGSEEKGGGVLEDGAVREMKGLFNLFPR